MLLGFSYISANIGSSYPLLFPKDDWGKNVCESPPAIYAYIKELVTKHALGSHIAFNSKVVAAEWQTDFQRYKITIEDTRFGARTTSIAEVIISAHGLLHIPNMPPIQGLDSFNGLLFHSSQWDTSPDLSWKRVAVTGNGGSAYVNPFASAFAIYDVFQVFHCLFAQLPLNKFPNIVKLENINVT
jgi:cation diffusion facilitator CzcD-associated flavoprotein CzcO